jgi:hypothetical protein
MKKICPCLFFTFSYLIISSHLSCAVNKDNIALQGTADEIYLEILRQIQAKNFRKAEELLNNVLTSKRLSIDGMRVLEEVFDKLESYQDEPVLGEWCETIAHHLVTVNIAFCKMSNLAWRKQPCPLIFENPGSSD